MAQPGSTPRNFPGLNPVQDPQHQGHRALSLWLSLRPHSVLTGQTPHGTHLQLLDILWLIHRNRPITWLQTGTAVTRCLRDLQSFSLLPSLSRKPSGWNTETHQR